jgi:predicted methyltransferase
MRHLLGFGLLALFLSGCGEKPPAATPEQSAAVTNAQTTATSVSAALQHPDRLSGDANEDEWRKPNEVLALLDVKPGMRVIDYFSGGGYYTEILSRVVGPEGQVIAYNNEPYLKYAANKPTERYGNERLPNVAQLNAAPEQLPLEPESADAALIVNAYHDLHWVSKDGSWPSTDPKAALEKLAAALKPGASVVVVDHVATAGSDPAQSVEALHRIDPEVIKRDFEAAGFTFEAESNALRNSTDDYTVAVFDPTVRHKTDQVIFKFRKRLAVSG